MPIALVFNPGSNSLKFEVIQCEPSQEVASQAKKLASAVLDGIGKHTKLLVYQEGKIVSQESSPVGDMSQAVSAALEWMHGDDALRQVLQHLTLIAIRVVHGGSKYADVALMSEEVRNDIEAMEDLAPLHNRSSLNVLAALEGKLSGVPVFVSFDTAFHRTLPEKAWRYPIDREMADRYGVRKFGFHGVSHRYMLEQYAYTAGKVPESSDLVTLHLEGGCSACAIERGKSVDTTMGLTPLEGLMMGSRSGSVDPAIVPYLMRKEHKSAEDILTVLNKQSGLLGIAGGSQDTRDLMKRSDHPARLSLEMFGYRVRLAVGSYLAALENVDAVVFGGGIGEDSPWLRETVCAGLVGWGLELDKEANQSTVGMCQITTESSRLHAWVIPAEECLQIAHECMKKLAIQIAKGGDVSV